MNPSDGDESDIFDYSHVFDKVEIWNLLGRMMVTDVLIAAFFVESGMSDVSYLHGQTGGILLADKTLENILKKGLAETHLHLNAGIEYEALWSKIISSDNWRESVKSKENYKMSQKSGKLMGIHIVVFRLVFAEFLEDERHLTCTFAEFIHEEYSNYNGIVETLMRKMYKGIVPAFDPKWTEFVDDLLKSQRIKYRVNETCGDLLFDTVYYSYKDYGTYSELIFFDEGAYLYKKQLF